MGKLRKRSDVNVKSMPFAAHTSRISFELFDEKDNVIFRIRKEPAERAKRRIEEILGFKL